MARNTRLNFVADDQKYGHLLSNLADLCISTGRYSTKDSWKFLYKNTTRAVFESFISKVILLPDPEDWNRKMHGDIGRALSLCFKLAATENALISPLHLATAIIENSPFVLGFMSQKIGISATLAKHELNYQQPFLIYNLLCSAVKNNVGDIVLTDVHIFTRLLRDYPELRKAYGLDLFEVDELTTLADQIGRRLKIEDTTIYFF